MMMRAARKLLFFLSVFYFLLLLTISQGEQEPVVHVKEEPYASSMGMGGEGWEDQRLSRMGSRPPCCVCERRCGGCTPCTAVQVRAVGAVVGPQCASYEPVRWKCKCGDAVFDP